MRLAWEHGLRGRIYAWGRSVIPLAWRRAVRRYVNPERVFGIRKSVVELPRFDFDPGKSRPGREDVLILPVIAWTYRRQRPQHLAEALARRGRRVFYGSLIGTGEPREAVGVAPDVTLLPIAGVRHVDPADRELGGSALEKALTGLAASRERFDLAHVVLLIQAPYWSPLALSLRARYGWRIVYDCLDAHEGFSSNRRPMLVDKERQLAAAAEFVTCTSAGLQQRMSECNPTSRLLPNACDFERFSATPPAHPDLEKLAVGYAGAVDEWFDIELLAGMARLRPLWKFEIVGGIEDVRLKIPRFLPNVTFHGERPYREMAGYRARFDVEVIPFRLSELTHATDPVKFYEAAAAGRMIVATPMRSLAAFADQGLIRRASTPERFIEEIEAAARSYPESGDRLHRFARENTWDIRAATLDSWLGKG